MEETKGSKRKGENRKRFPNGEEEGGRQRGERPEQRTQRDAQRSREEDEGDRERQGDPGRTADVSGGLAAVVP